MEPSGTLGYLVWERRDRDGLSVREAAREIGCNPMVVSRVEAGEAPSVRNLARIFEWLRIRPTLALEAVREFA